jgi:hypothetical protein
MPMCDPLRSTQRPSGGTGSCSSALVALSFSPSLDVATRSGVTRHPAEFGMTLLDERLGERGVERVHGDRSSVLVGGRMDGASAHR